MILSHLHILIVVTTIILRISLTLVLILITTLVVILANTTLVVTVLLRITSRNLLSNWCSLTLRALLILSRISCTELSSILSRNRLHQKSKETGKLIGIGVVHILIEVLSLVTLPILFIFSSLVNEITLSFHFIMIDVERTLVDMKISIFNLTCDIRSLETNKCIRRFLFLLTKYSN